MVTAVIPTIGRAELPHAVESALAQKGIDCEVVVVADCQVSGAEDLGLSSFDTDRVRICATGGGKGGAAARQLGTEVARAPWVAYLDDDDRWEPQKLAKQLEGQDAADRVLLAARAWSVSPSGRSIATPRQTYSDGSLAAYLFYRRRLSAARNVLPTSSLVLPTWFALEVGWDVSLQRHQDWDFVLRCERNGARIVQHEDPLLWHYAGSSDSTSGTSNWKASFEWVAAQGRGWSPNVRADFLASQPLRYALQARDLSGVRRVAREIAALKQVPSWRAVLIGLAGLASRQTFVRASHALGSRTHPTPGDPPR